MSMKLYGFCFFSFPFLFFFRVPICPMEFSVTSLGNLGTNLFSKTKATTHSLVLHKTLMCNLSLFLWIPWGNFSPSLLRWLVLCPVYWNSPDPDGLIAWYFRILPLFTFISLIIVLFTAYNHSLQVVLILWFLTCLSELQTGNTRLQFCTNSHPKAIQKMACNKICTCCIYFNNISHVKTWK